MYVLSAVYKAHVFQTNMNVFKDLLKKQKINSFVNNQEYEIQLGKINSRITNIILNIRHWYMLEMNLLNSVNGNVIQSQVL